MVATLSKEQHQNEIVRRALDNQEEWRLGEERRASAWYDKVLASRPRGVIPVRAGEVIL